MAPVQSGVLAPNLSARANNGEFDATPTEAVVVPVAILILLLTGAAIVSVYRYWRRRNGQDQLYKFDSSQLKGSGTRKFVPNWLSNWMDSPTSKSPHPNAGTQSRSLDTTKPGGITIEHFPDRRNVDLDSDTVALRPNTVYLPAYPLTAHDPYDRYPAGIGTVRPKVLGAPLR